MEVIVMRRVIDICSIVLLAVILGEDGAAQSRMIKLTLLPAADLRSLSWLTLASDRKGDGIRQRLPDARELSYAIDRQRDLVWFRVTVNDPLPEYWFGMNVAIDSDDLPDNGLPWLGTNKVKFDRVASAYLFKAEDYWQGYAGVADSDSFTQDVSSLTRAVQLAVDREQRTILFGIPRSALGARESIRVIATVGSMIVNNDDVPDEGMVTVRLASQQQNANDAGGPTPSLQTTGQDRPVILAASTLLDGRGGLRRNTRIVVRGTQIAAIEPNSGPVDFDLRGLTVMPGWIDTHVHITWRFGADGKSAGMGGGTPESAYGAAANAWATLMGGFTTVQSLGAPGDVLLRDAIAKGELPGPRILTAVVPLYGRGDASGTADQIRAHIRQQKAAGADVIKIFASGGMHENKLMLSPAQLYAACDEAKKQGLRSVVHAYGHAVRMAVLAGCTQIEHGLNATNDDLRLMAERKIYFDPQVGLLLETYLVNKRRYLGTPLFDEGTFAMLERMAPIHHELMRRAVQTFGLKIVFGSDAVAGAHGRNAEELVFRVREGRQNPATALISAQSVAAEALGMSDRIGSIAPGLEADIIAIDGNPLEDITAVRRVVFVMKGGVIFKNRVPSINQREHGFRVVAPRFCSSSASFRRTL